MKFLIVFAVVVVAANAQFLRDFGAVVEGAKATIAGPSGTIHSDTGAIVKSPRPILDAPAVISARTVIRTPTIISSPLLHAPLLRTPFDFGLRSFPYGDLFY